MNQLWEEYLIPVNYFEYLYDYIDKLAEAIDFQLDVKESLINFLNCVDYCKGFYLSDSIPVSEDKIIIDFEFRLFLTPFPIVPHFLASSRRIRLCAPSAATLPKSCALADRFCAFVLNGDSICGSGWRYR